MAIQGHTYFIAPWRPNGSSTKVNVDITAGGNATRPAADPASPLEFRASAIEGQGAFAAADLVSGMRLVEYVGQKIDKRESNRRCEAQNHFIFYLDEEFDLDGQVGWNPARFFNHSCTPNCEAVMAEGRIWIVALRDIAIGEELCFNYGYDLEDYREHPCHCGSPHCVGYMVAEELFAHVRSAGMLPSE